MKPKEFLGISAIVGVLLVHVVGWFIFVALAIALLYNAVRFLAAQL